MMTPRVCATYIYSEVMDGIKLENLTDEGFLFNS